MADESVDEVNARPPLPALVPLPLRNWQVLDQTAVPVEIDGEATVINPPTTPTPAAGDEGREPVAPPPSLQASDQIDDAIIVSLATRQQQIAAGTTATYEVTLLNNGPTRAFFTLRLAESRLALWLATPIPGVALQPGERALLPVAFTPPKAAMSRAGDYRLTFVVEADAYPQRQSQVAASLTILPFVELQLGKVALSYRTLTWWRRSVTVTVPLINRGNVPTPVALRAQDGAGVCQITFQGKGVRQNRQQQALVTLPPGQTTPLTLQLYAQSQAWFGRTKRSCPIQLTLTAKAAPSVDQSALIKVVQAPVIGPWQIATLVGLFSMVVTGLGLGGLAVLIALLVSFAQPAPSAPSISSAVPPPIVTILVQPAPVRSQPVNVAQPAPAPVVVAPVRNDVVAALPSSTGPQPATRDPAVPLVEPNQISTPGGGSVTSAAAASAAAQPADSAAVVAPENVTAPNGAPVPQRMTYAQMFQEIGLRYDLNWRMLAAQAYEESSFDTLALGSHGDLGLMQIRPSTWREWAPTVDAADPFDSYSNVLVAAAYLDYLRTTLSKEGHPEREWMLVAYNWGPDKVRQHLANGGTWADLSPELQHYVEDILRLAETIPPDGAF